jgi:hypothetical protein
MTARSFHHQDLEHSAMLDWLLVLAGALLAWLLWPASFH